MRDREGRRGIGGGCFIFNVSTEHGNQVREDVDKSPVGGGKGRSFFWHSGVVCLYLCIDCLMSDAFHSSFFAFLCTKGPLKLFKHTVMYSL